MKTLKYFFKNIWISATSENSKLHREWDRQRSMARTPSELSEIDAIFARHL